MALSYTYYDQMLVQSFSQVHSKSAYGKSATQIMRDLSRAMDGADLYGGLSRFLLEAIAERFGNIPAKVRTDAAPQDNTCVCIRVGDTYSKDYVVDLADSKHSDEALKEEILFDIFTFLDEDEED